MFIRIYYYLLGICVLCSIVLFASRTISTVWLLDIIVSFLPLVTLGSVFIFSITFLCTALYFSSSKTQRIGKKELIIGTLLLISLSSNIASIIQITSALSNTVLAHEGELTKNARMHIEVGFFNKYYYNENLTPIIDEVIERNLDIFGMAEISEEEYQTLREEIAMPYTYYENCHCHNIMGDPVAIFSQYPLEEIKTGRLGRIGSIEAKIILPDGRDIQVITTHPDAPMNTKFFKSRNEQIENLDILLQNYRDTPLLLIGDLNISPWSPRYKELLAKNPFLKDSARGFGLPSTWGPGFIRTKIDHILVSQGIGVKNFQTVHIPGSDHDMIHVSLAL